MAANTAKRGLVLGNYWLDKSRLGLISGEKTGSDVIVGKQHGGLAGMLGGGWLCDAPTSVAC